MNLIATLPLLLTTSVDASGSCFSLQEANFDAPPFDNASIAQMAKYFVNNLNINGTGAVIAARGDCPALHGSPGAYHFHWMRDSALSMRALMETAELTGVDDSTVQHLVQNYMGWIENVTGGSAEPKWNLTTHKPFAHPWCRPQTDGPPLRASTLMAIHARYPAIDTWKLASADLDWIGGPGSAVHFNSSSCDLWEESMDEPNLLWNRVAMRAALLAGASVAKAKGDATRQAAYARAASELVGDPFAQHTHPANGSIPSYFTECPPAGYSDSCGVYDKQVDGAVILALVHANGAVTDAADPASAQVAKTVGAYNDAFCGAYPINRKGLPGVLYGRYERDAYGGGNPWVLITAALANLLYRAASSSKATPPPQEAVAAWQATFGKGFGYGKGGLPAAFVAAGDSVLRRLRSHVAASDENHLWEQIDKKTGKQYNAKDLTWSYAETLGAIVERNRALAALRG